MSTIVAWVLLALGITHIAYGLVKFKVPLAEALAGGIIGQFKAPEIRRTAFWFLMCGPLLILSGHVAVHAVAVGDLALLKVVGIYTLVSSAIGVAVFPKSPFWASLLLSPLLIAAGYGLLP
jgi:uncharacterized membrane protein HdeD (DUF308 family)